MSPRLVSTPVLAMTRLQPLSSLSLVSRDVLVDQAQLRRTLLGGLFEAMRGAPSFAAALAALQARSEEFVAVGLHDEAARLGTFARILTADVALLEREAAQLEARASAPAPVVLAHPAVTAP